MFQKEGMAPGITKVVGEGGKKKWGGGGGVGRREHGRRAGGDPLIMLGYGTLLPHG